MAKSESDYTPPRTAVEAFENDFWGTPTGIAIIEQDSAEFLKELEAEEQAAKDAKKPAPEKKK